MKKERWRLLVTRETVLLERQLRMLSYEPMLNNYSPDEDEQIFTVNRDGMTSMYINSKSENITRKKLYEDYKSKNNKNLFGIWKKDIDSLKEATKEMILNKDVASFDKFTEEYKKIRRIVLHSEYLLKELEKDKKEDKKIVMWHEHSETESCKAWDSCLHFFKKLADRNKVLKEDLMYLTLDELDEVIADKTKIKRASHQSRKIFYVMIVGKNKTLLYTGKKAQDAIKNELPAEKIKRSKILKGLVANKGYAKGIVSIINTSEDVKKMRKGDVVVSAMTTPRLYPAMSKASAIVTDEGGLTSHAAIISRELGIPCIIGTKHATKILKDGDLIEVDADKGIVRRLR